MKKLVIATLIMNISLFGANDLFRDAKNFWVNTSKSKNIEPPSNVSFPLWLDGLMLQENQWKEFIKIQADITKDIIKRYNARAEDLHFFLKTKAILSDLNKYDNFPRFQKLLKKHKELELIITLWSKDIQLGKKTGSTFIYKCKNQDNCKLIGIDDKLLLINIKGK